MKKSLNGFTIVELLIVVVVIAILATISIITYNSLQKRANNTRTISAVTAYVKALQIYKLDQGQYPPTGRSCLGTKACDSSNSFVVNGSNLNSSYLSPYLGSSIPTPAPDSGTFSTGRELSGAGYTYNEASYGGANNGGIGMYHQGSGDCPAIGGTTYVGLYTYADGSDIWCRYSLN